MKHHLIASITLLAACLATAQDLKTLTPITGAGVVTSTDYIPMIDVSANGLKGITIDEMWKALVGSSVSVTEVGYLDGVTGPIQTQFTGKQATLVSGTTIKTVNGTSLLGAGDLTVAVDASKLVAFRSDLTLNNAGNYNGVYYRAVEFGTDANTITVAHVISGSGTGASVAVVSRAITVTAGSNCTSATLVSAVNAHAPAAALVTASNLGTSTALVVAKSATPLHSSVTQGADGSITLGLHTGDSALSITSPDPGPGNFYLQDMKYLGWKNADGSVGPNIRWWQAHDAVAGEWIFSSPWRSAEIQPGPKQLGSNASLPDAYFAHYTSGAPAVDNPLRRSKAISQQTYTYVPAVSTTAAGSFTAGLAYKIAAVGSTSFTAIGASANTVGVRFIATGAGSGTGTAYLLTATANNVQYQAVPLDESGTNTALRFFSDSDIVGSLGGYNINNGQIVGTQMLEISKAATKAPSFTATSGGVTLLGGGITFSDSTTLTSATQIPTVRAGTTTLVTGTRTVSDATVTAYTAITLSRKTAAGTTGELTYTINPGVGFTINSASATETSRIAYHLFEGVILNLTPPSVSGTTAVTDTLTVTDNEASGSRQWFSNGAAVSGETGSTYVIRHQDIGLAVKCQVGGIDSNSVTVWKPSDETGLVADFRGDTGMMTASGGSAVTTHGAAVGYWVDQSSGGNSLQQPTGTSQPILDLTTEAGFPHLYFDGNASTSDFLYRNYATPETGGPHTLPQTAYVVAKTIAAGANKRMLTTDTAGQRLLVRPDGGSGMLNNSATSTGYSLSAKNIITARTSSSTNYVRVDAGTEFSDASVTNTIGNGIWIGAISASTGVECRIYGTLLYRADHDSAAQIRVRKYLKAKWGTP